MGQEKKYELVPDAEERFMGRVVHRICAMRDFGCVHAGGIGGFVESEDNLSQEGEAWIYGDAVVCDGAKVLENASVSGYAKVLGNASVYNDAVVAGHASVYGNARVYGKSRVNEGAPVYGQAEVGGFATVTGHASVCGEATINGVAGVTGSATVCGPANLYEGAEICGEALVTDNADYATVKGFGRDNRQSTFFRCRDGKVRARRGCFYGTIPEFREIVKDTHGDSKMAKEYLAIADLMELHFAKEGGGDRVREV